MKSATAAARARRDKGIIDSILHADHNADGWPERAFAYLLQWSALAVEPWTVETFRQWAQDNGLDQPPDLRAFGGVTQRAIRRGLIARVGYARTNSSNRSFMPHYFRCVGVGRVERT
jgi:hypothetical protein